MICRCPDVKRIGSGKGVNKMYANYSCADYLDFVYVSNGMIEFNRPSLFQAHLTPRGQHRARVVHSNWADTRHLASGGRDLRHGHMVCGTV